MNIKPIIYSTAMVKARRAGLKTQTRRVVKPQPGCGVKDFYNRPDGLWQPLHLPKGSGVGIGFPIKCPYQIGQTVWIRETWSMPDYFDHLKPSEINQIHKDEIRYKADDEKASGKTRPSIYYPRWAARSFDKITNIRIERIQDISEEDAMVEGCELPDIPMYADEDLPTYINAFWRLWDSINKKRGYGWDKNPYVWVYDFEVIK